MLNTWNNTVPFKVDGNGNVSMTNDLSVGGDIITSGKLQIIENSGTEQGVNNGTIILDHENAGGVSSIVFRSKVNRGSDYGNIQYQDSSVVGGGGESARLIIGTQNDSDNNIVLLPTEVLV